MRKSLRIIDEAETEFLDYGLRVNNAKSVKTVLQRLCIHYEAGRRLDDPINHRTTIHSHLHSDDVLLRRWSLKALSLISHPDDMHRIVDRLRVESDPEALTWGAAGLLKRAGSRSLSQVSKEAGLESTKALNLAARLYAPATWITDHLRTETISLKDDPLILKWAIFLIGYKKAPDALFSPEYENSVFLGELNQHPLAEVAEYSIWAFWERRDFGLSNFRLTEQQIRELPASARKWAYRLYATGQRSGAFTCEMFDLFRRDVETTAREGLALGLVDYCGPSLDGLLFEWFDDEGDEAIRETLLAVMAANGARNPDFADLVIRRYSDADPVSPLRKRLVASTEPGTALYGELRRIKARSEFVERGLLEFMSPELVFGDKVVGNKITVGGDINAQNFAGGDMNTGVMHSVQQLSAGRPEDAEILKSIISMLSKQDVPEELRTVISPAVGNYAEKPSASSKSALMSAINLGKKAFSTIAALSEIYLAASHLSGS